MKIFRKICNYQFYDYLCPMNYQTLLDSTYQNIMTCDLTEIEHYRNIANKLVDLVKENKN